MARGHFRSVPTVTPDSQWFQALSPGAKLVWYTLTMSLGGSGIDVVTALTGTLMERTGLDAVQAEKGLAQLEAAGLVRRERSVVWMVNGLRDDPHLTLSNQNHRVQIAEHLNRLPPTAIVDEFRAHYGFATPPTEMVSPAPDEGAKEGKNMPSKSPSMMASKTPSISSKKRRVKSESDEGEGSSAAGASALGRAGRPTWLSPFAREWRSRYGGEMSAGKAVKALRRLVDEHGNDEVLRRWTIYLTATAAEYANAPKFAETWGRWAAVVVRTSPSQASAFSPRDEARVEAGQIVAQIRALVFDQTIPGQGSRRLLRLADVEALGPEIAAAVKNTGGVARVLKLETDASDISFYIGDFAAQLHAARHSTNGVTPEVQSA